jgi:choline kinase
MMPLHIYSAAFLNQLAMSGVSYPAVTLGIDRRVTSPLIDPDDATWVQTDARGFIRAIGKTIPEYDAVDCGAFLATPELAAAIAEAVVAGRGGSLSDGMQRLADQGRAATLDIGEAWWLDVDDPRAQALAEVEAPVQLKEIY